MRANARWFVGSFVLGRANCAHASTGRRAPFTPFHVLCVVDEWSRAYMSIGVTTRPPTAATIAECLAAAMTPHSGVACVPTSAQPRSEPRDTLKSTIQGPKRDGTGPISAANSGDGAAAGPADSTIALGGLPLEVEIDRGVDSQTLGEVLARLGVRVSRRRPNMPGRGGAIERMFAELARCTTSPPTHKGRRGRCACAAEPAASEDMAAALARTASAYHRVAGRDGLTPLERWGQCRWVRVARPTVLAAFGKPASL